MSSENLVNSDSLSAVPQITETPVAQPTEKVVNLPQSQFDKIVQTAKIDAAAKARNEVLSQLQQQQTQQAPLQTHTYSSHGQPVNVEELVAKEIQKNFQAIQQQNQDALTRQEMTRFVNDLQGKIDVVKNEHPNLEGFVGDVMGVFPNTVWLANELDNAADVLLDFQNHPEKMQTIQGLAERDTTGRLAREALKKLSQSISANKKAQGMQFANSPVSHVKPVSVNHDDDGGGSGSVSDIRRMLRGR